MKQSFGKKHLAVSFVCGALFFSGVSFAANQQVDVNFSSLNFLMEGEKSVTNEQYDNGGTQVPESLIYNGTTYVPVRLVGDLVGFPVYWEQQTSSVSVGQPHVELLNGNGDTVGMAVLSATDNGVAINIQASGLPSGKLGFHVHESPITGGDFQTAGGHFNPDHNQHGHLNPQGSHIGDMPNLEVNEAGTVQAEIVIEGANLQQGDPHSLLGKSLIIHAGEDDYVTDPAGDSGDRIIGGNIPQ